MPIKQSFCLPCFHKPQGDLEGLLRESRRIGFVGCEIWHRDEAVERTAALARENGVPIVSMCGHKDWRNGLNKRENHDRIESELRASIELASRLGIPGIICFSGPRQPNLSPEDSIAACADGLRRCLPFAEERHVTINMELLNSRVDHINYEFDRTSWGVELCKRLDSPRFRILYDIYHAQIMEGDVIRAIRNNLPYIAHIHTAGNPDRHDLDDEQELNYKAIARAIASSGYTGFVGHEFFPKGDPIEALGNAFALCDV